MTLELRDIGVTRSGTTVLSGVSARLEGGQIVGLVGPNGTGKSTLIQAVAGLLPFSGDISWRGRPVSRRETGHMPQHCHVRADLSVAETVLLGRHERLGWRVRSAHLDRAAAVLDEFGIASLGGRSMRTLSGGQQQLVLLAQRLVREPGLLLLDEATSALDLRHQMQVFERLRAYVERSGALVVIAIHDLNLAARHADTVLLLDRGRAAGLGRFEQVIRKDTLRAVYGIEAEILASASGAAVVLPLAPAPPA